MCYSRYLCLCTVVSNTYCVVFLVCLSSSCVPYVASISGLSILIAPLVFSIYILTFIYRLTLLLSGAYMWNTIRQADVFLTLRKTVQIPDCHLCSIRPYQLTEQILLTLNNDGII